MACSVEIGMNFCSPNIGVEKTPRRTTAMLSDVVAVCFLGRELGALG